MYGHVEKLAEEIRKGAASVEGVEAKLWQVNTFAYSAFSFLYLSVDEAWFEMSLESSIFNISFQHS